MLSVGWDMPLNALLVLGPTFYRYYNAIVGLMMTFLVISSKIQDLQHLGRTICLKNKHKRHMLEDCLKT